MRVLILGGNGMLGHKAAQKLSARFGEVAVTVRGDGKELSSLPGLEKTEIFGGVTVEEIASVEAAIVAFKPTAVVNCIGLIKHLEESKESARAIEVNSLFPHQAAGLSADHGARFIHISTDCVFSGEKGPYTEDAVPDPRDLYGRSKLLGEVSAPGCLTIRSSVIGRELERQTGLGEWLISQQGGRIKGFVNALYTGLATPSMADVIGKLIERHRHLDGIWNIASDAINKYDLLVLINEKFGLGITIERDESFSCDRRLDGSRFAKETGIDIPAWPDMIDAMVADSTPYRSMVPDSKAINA